MRKIKPASRPISIHAPRAGSDFCSWYFFANFIISIHAPRAGSDLQPAMPVLIRRNFNPRSPCGERRLCSFSH